MKKTNHKTLIRKLQAAVNLYARLRDCAGTGGANCISCGTWKPFEELEGCHFIPTTSSATRFDLRNINAGCIRCNKFLHGNYRNYYDGMRLKYGQRVIDNLQSKQYLVKKWTIPELEKEYAKVQRLMEELKTPPFQP